MRYTMPNEASVCTGGPQQKDARGSQGDGVTPTITPPGRRAQPQDVKKPQDQPESHQRAPKGRPGSHREHQQELPRHPRDPQRTHQNPSGNHMLTGSQHVLPTQALSQKGTTMGFPQGPPSSSQGGPREAPRPRRESNADRGQHLSPSQAKPNKTGVQNSAPLGINQ